MRLATDRGFQRPLVWAALLGLGCSRGAATAGAPTTGAPTAGAPAVSATAQPARSADEILQARLQEAARRPGRAAPEPLSPPPQLPLGALNVPQARARAPSGRGGQLPPSLIQSVVRGAFGRFRRCYEDALVRRHDLAGSVVLKFTIQRDGSVAGASAEGNIPDATARSCTVEVVSTLSFPRPEGGIVTVTYPINFSPSGEVPAPAASARATAAPLPAEPLTAAPAAAAPPADGGVEDPWPIVAVDGDHVLLDGVARGTSRSVVELGRLQKLDDLFDALKARVEAWRARHPGQPHAGVLGLRALPDTPLMVFKSAFQTAAFSGYPFALVQLSTEPARIFEIEAQIPQHPLAPPPPPVFVAVHLRESDVQVVWKDGSAVTDEAMATPTTLGQIVCEGWKLHGLHREPSDTRRDDLVLHAVDTLPLRAVLASIEAVQTCRRPLRADGEPPEIPVFRVVFSIR